MHAITIVERTPITPTFCLVTAHEFLLVTQVIEIMPGVLLMIVDVYTRTFKTVEFFKIKPPVLLSEGPFDAIQNGGMSFGHRTLPSHDDVPDALSPALFDFWAQDDLFDQPGLELTLADEVADLESELGDYKQELAERDSQLGDALLQIEELKAQLSQSQAREQLLSDRLNVEAVRRRDSESKVEGLERELSHERLARGALSDRLLTKDRDLLRLGDRYNELKTENASLVSKLHAKGNALVTSDYRRDKAERKIAALNMKLRVRQADGEPTILIRELLADLSSTEGTPR